MIDPKTIYLSGEAAKFHKPGKWIDQYKYCI